MGLGQELSYAWNLTIYFRRSEAHDALQDQGVHLPVLQLLQAGPLVQEQEGLTSLAVQPLQYMI